MVSQSWLVVPHDVFLLNNQHYCTSQQDYEKGSGQVSVRFPGWFWEVPRFRWRVWWGSFCNRGSGAGCVVVPEILLGWFTRFGVISGVGSGIRYTSTGLRLDRCWVTAVTLSTSFAVVDTTRAYCMNHYNHCQTDIIITAITLLLLLLLTSSYYIDHYHDHCWFNRLVMDDLHTHCVIREWTKIRQLVHISNHYDQS